LLEGSDACFAPVLDVSDAPAHPHNRARGTFIDVDGVTQPAPSPRFSRTVAEIKCPPPMPGIPNDEVLSDWGFAVGEVNALRRSGVLA
jgi:alpha-methylacyl-CoA racemase